MDFDFTPEQRDFVAEVEAFLDEHATVPDVADPTRENMAQIVDTPARRAFMKKMADRGWFGITWPQEWGGKDGDGVYEYLLNEALARRGPDRKVLAVARSGGGGRGHTGRAGRAREAPPPIGTVDSIVPAIPAGGRPRSCSKRATAPT